MRRSLGRRCSTFRSTAPARSTSSQARLRESRKDLLTQVYGPAFHGLVPGSLEYLNLARSGLVWERHFKPYCIEPYLAAQSQLGSTLGKLDAWRNILAGNPSRRLQILNALIAQACHQSASIEKNPLSLGVAGIIQERLSVLRSCEHLDESTDLPAPATLFSNEDAHHVAEMRNLIFLSRFITENAIRNPGSPGPTLTEIKQISKLMLIETNSEALYRASCGKRISLGDFRTTPIQVRSNPRRIFPYHLEIPAIMERFIQWRDRLHSTKQLHPVILALHMCVYFAHIHPFLDSNGRISRLLMADYMIRQGFLPIIFPDLDRDDYIGMISDAQDGMPEAFCHHVVETQSEMLFTLLIDSL